MSFRFSASRILHEEHMASLDLLTEVGRNVLGRKDAPAQGDAAVERPLRRLTGALSGEIAHHFDFEERALLPFLAECGAGDLADLLIEEHGALRDLFGEIDAVSGRGLASGFEPAEWMTLRRLCGELIERLQSHIEKEERALVPAIEASLNPQADAEFCARHDQS